MTVRVFSTYHFEAAHHLPLVPDGHKCKRLHGHTYVLHVSVAGAVDAQGFVIDFASLDAVVNPLVEQLDHRNLNEIEGLDNPTSEVIALWFKKRIAAALPFDPTIRLYETPRHWVEA